MVEPGTFRGRNVWEWCSHCWKAARMHGNSVPIIKVFKNSQEYNTAVESPFSDHKCTGLQDFAYKISKCFRGYTPKSSQQNGWPPPAPTPAWPSVCVGHNCPQCLDPDTIFQFGLPAFPLVLFYKTTPGWTSKVWESAVSCPAGSGVDHQPLNDFPVYFDVSEQLTLLCPHSYGREH